MDIELLSPERLAYWCDLIEIPDQAVAALQEIATQINADEELRSIFAAFHEKTARCGEWQREWAPLPFDTAVQAQMGERTSLFYLLAHLSALPFSWQTYQKLDISMEIFKATMLDFRFYMEDYYDLHGHWGYAQFAWIWRHLACELFRLGRMQYMLAPFEGGVTAFRYRSSQGAGPAPLPSPLLLADPRQPLRPDGYAWGAGQSDEEKTPEGAGSWRPTFLVTPNGWSGYPVLPDGRVQKPPVWLPATQWDIILRKGDMVLDLHIPRKDPLNAETCSASYAQAMEFFGRVFPTRPFKALYCHTWMFTPQLQQFLSPESNLVKFQREFYLYPFAGNVGFLWTFVFGEKYPDRQTAPRDTSLRRAVLDWLENGGEIFDLPGLMFHPPQEWGAQPYWQPNKL